MNAETKRCFAALLRKQRREQSAFLNRSARTGKQRTQTGKLAFGMLYGAIALVLMASFASLSWPLAQLLLPGGWETLYFLVLELLALLVSVLAGALSSYNRLFQAKDNDLLLALPIPPWMIFAVRLWGLYEMSLFYLLLVWVPAEAAYARFAPHPLGGILSAVPMALLLAVAASVLAALLGWFIISAEPAVAVLEKQIEEVSAGAIPGGAIKVSLSVAIALAMALAMLRVVTGISILWFLVPGYAIALGLSLFVPDIYTAIAFDSGGVASGPMTATFMLQFMMGVSIARGGNVLTDAFGIVAMVAMMPLLSIQTVGVIYQRKAQRAAQELESYGDCDIIELWEEAA